MPKILTNTLIMMFINTKLLLINIYNGYKISNKVILSKQYIYQVFFLIYEIYTII